MSTASKPAAERRWSARFQPTLGTVFRMDGPAGRRSHLGLVWNLSETGVGMLVPEPFEPGAAVEGELTAAEAGASLPVRLRVAHVRKLETGDYFLGGQFQRPLAADEMRPFLAAPPPDRNGAG